MTDAVVRFSQLPLLDEQRWRALELASPAEAERYRRDRSETFLLGRLLLRDLVAEISGAPAVITAVCPKCGDEHGRPRSESLFLSISHTEAVVVVAAATTRIGVDVEKDDTVVPPEFARGVRQWTQLEAVLKAEGRGFDADPHAVRLRRGAAFLGGVRYALADIETMPGYITSLAQATTAIQATPAAPAVHERSARRRAARQESHR